MTLDVTHVTHGLTLTDAFRDHVAERAERLAPMAPEGQSLEVKAARVSHHRHSEETIRVELTLRSPRDVVRAASEADDKIAAFDAAATRLAERLRRLRDRRKDRRQGKGARSAGQVPFVAPLPASGKELVAEDAAAVPETGTPVTIREKAFPATPMTVEDAVDAMELVGHDFYLFQDESSGVPSVVYRRRGWSYGVLRLDPELPDHAAGATTGERVYREGEIA